MPSAVPNREAIDRRLGRLQQRFDAFEIEEETITNDPDFFEHGRRLVEDGWLGDAGAWVEDGDGQVLLIRHAEDSELWGTPGGGHEPDETFPETARREVREETGIECSLTDVYWCRRRTVVHEEDPDRRFEMLTVVFEAEAVGGETEVDDEEILEARWFEEPPDRVADFLKSKVGTWVDRE